MRRKANATLITLAAAGLLAGAGTAWIVSHGGPDRPGVPNLPFAVPVAVLIGWSFIGDPSLALGYWFQAETRYVDRDGKPVEPPGPRAIGGPRWSSGTAGRSPC